MTKLQIVYLHFFIVVQSLSRVQLFATPWTAARQASLSITNSWSLLKLMSIESVMPWNHLILRRSLLLPSIFPSIRVFSNESALCIRWPKYWSLSFSIGPSNEYSELISFRINWFDLLAIQGTLKSLLQHHSLKASILWRSAFFMLQLSHPYMTTAKTTALTIWTFVGKVISLLFNMLSRFVIAFLPRSKPLVISWLQSPSAVILDPKKIKSVTVSIFPPSICYEVMGLDDMILVFWMLSFSIRIPLSTFYSRPFSLRRHIFLKYFVYFWPCWVLVAVQAFSSCGKWGLLPSGAWASHWVGLSCYRARALRRVGSVAVAHGLSCPVACGVFPDQGSNQCSLHWQENSLPLGHQGSP